MTSRRRSRQIAASVGGDRAEPRRIRRGREFSSQSGAGHGKRVYQIDPKLARKQRQKEGKVAMRGIRSIAERIGLVLPDDVKDD